MVIENNENNVFSANIENYYESSVADDSMSNKNGFYIIVIICIIAYVFGYDSLQKAYESTNNLLFYFFKVLLESLPYFCICFALSKLCLMFFKKKKNNNNLLGTTIGIAIIFFCIYDLLDEPNRIKISEDRTSNFSYKCAIIGDIFSNQTTTVDVKEITTQESYSKSTGGRKT